MNRIVFTVFALCAFQLTAGSSLDDIGATIETLISQLEKDISTAGSRIQENFQNQADKLEVQLEEQFNQIKVDFIKSMLNGQSSLSVDPAVIKSCFDAEEPNFNITIDKAKSQLTAYIAKEGLIYLLPLLGNVNATFNKAKSLGSDSVEDIEACFDQSGFLSKIICMSDLFSSVKTQVREIGEEVSAEMQQFTNMEPNLVSDFATSVNNIVNTASPSITASGNAIIQCIKDNSA